MAATATESGRRTKRTRYYVRLQEWIVLIGVLKRNIGAPEIDVVDEQ